MYHDELDGRGIYSHNDIDQHIAATPEIQRGFISITPTANVPTLGTITFPVAFSGVPTVMLTPVTTKPGTELLGWALNVVDATSAQVYVTRNNTTATTIRWLAVYTP